MVLVIISLEEVYVYHVQESRGSLAQLERELDMMVKGEHWLCYHYVVCQAFREYGP